MSWQKEMAGSPGPDDVTKTFETNQSPLDTKHEELVCLLNKINKNLEKMNLYWEMITNTKL